MHATDTHIHITREERHVKAKGAYREHGHLAEELEPRIGRLRQQVPVENLRTHTYVRTSHRDHSCK